MLCPGSRSSSTARVPIQASSKPTTTHGRFEHGTAGLSMSWACSPRRRRGDVLSEVEEARRAPHGRLRAHDDARPALDGTIIASIAGWLSPRPTCSVPRMFCIRSSYMGSDAW